MAIVNHYNLFVHSDITRENSQNIFKHDDPKYSINSHVGPESLQTRMSSPAVSNSLISSCKNPDNTGQNHEKTTEEDEYFSGSQVGIEASTLSVA